MLDSEHFMIVKEKIILTEKNQEYSRSIKTIDNLCFNMCVCVLSTQGV